MTDSTLVFVKEPGPHLLFTPGSGANAVPLTVSTTQQQMFFRYKRLRKIPAEIGAFLNLTAVDLSGNRLCALPIEMGLLTQLKTLLLGGNSLNFQDVGLEAIFRSCLKIEILSLESGGLAAPTTRLLTYARRNVHLKEFNFSYNARLTRANNLDIVISMFASKSLETLDFRDNGVRPRQFGELVKKLRFNKSLVQIRYDNTGIGPNNPLRAEVATILLENLAAHNDAKQRASCLLFCGEMLAKKGEDRFLSLGHIPLPVLEVARKFAAEMEVPERFNTFQNLNNVYKSIKRPYEEFIVPQLESQVEELTAELAERPRKIARNADDPTDLRGVTRGACIKCDCILYVRPESGHSCAYCGCVPVHHATT